MERTDILFYFKDTKTILIICEAIENDKKNMIIEIRNIIKSRLVNTDKA